MIVSTSNIANDATVTITPESELQTISVITDGDYSSVYTDAISTSTEIEFVFDDDVSIGYIAIGGSNISRKTSIEIMVSESETEEALETEEGETITADDFETTITFADAVIANELGEDESVTLMYRIDQAVARRVTITVYGTSTLSLAEIAMGDYYEVPRGQQSGYNMAWTVPNIQARGATSLEGAPINLSYEARALSCTLTVPNNIMTDFQGWYKFIKFAASNTFYVLEDETSYHSYACFNATPAMTTNNASTRSLGSSSITFQAFAKSTEAIFSV